MSERCLLVKKNLLMCHWSLHWHDYAGSSVYREAVSNREGYSGLVESIGISIDEPSLTITVH
jgi:hypothetical protein